MKLQENKKETVMLVSAALIFFLAIIASILALPEKASDAASHVLGQQDQWTVQRGAPGIQGRKIKVSRQELLQGTLMLVSPDHPLPSDFSQPNTRTVRAMVGAYLPVWEETALLPEAVYSLCEMKLDYSLDAGITFTRGALSFAQLEERQRQAFDRFSQVYSLQDALQLAISTVPGGRESEHRTGYALDIELHPPLSLGKADPLQRNEVGQWLHENMWRYGWIRRYMNGEEGAGNCESIHVRYVGKAHAAAMHVLDLDLEAYWDLLRQEGELTVFCGDEMYAWLYCTPCNDTVEIILPEGHEYVVSADNTGWAAAAIAAQGQF